MRVSESLAVVGTVALDFAGVSGRSYLIAGPTNLTTWTRLSTNVAAGTALRYTDAESKTLPYRFYRARPLP